MGKEEQAEMDEKEEAGNSKLLARAPSRSLQDTIDPLE
jgi:hypothetical protein